jgi:hypothetical protein
MALESDAHSIVCSPALVGNFRIESIAFNSSYSASVFRIGRLAALSAAELSVCLTVVSRNHAIQQSEVY